MSENEKTIYLVTGGHGFIGSHVALDLHRRGLRVRVVDISEQCYLNLPDDIEFVRGNLCNEATCRVAVRGACTVLHFAANMGGMGTIHEGNDSIIFGDNTLMSKNIITVSVEAGVRRFFYASSACVYPNSLQTSDKVDVALKESDVWCDPPPRPQGLYGLEKLVSELLAINSTGRPGSQLEVRIARFHNVYGPGGAWANGREKAPAALLRKALAAKFLHDSDGAHPIPFEIWGDGEQRRSFLYIDDAVEAIWLLLNFGDASYCEPMNIGSSSAVSISELARIAVESVGMDYSNVDLYSQEDTPRGVAARNADLTLIREHLGWEQKTPLEEGMRLTGEWIRTQMESQLEGLQPSERAALIRSYTTSTVIDMKAEIIKFALLLPITSRGSASPGDCLLNLGAFARSLVGTTWYDLHESSGIRFRVKVYLAIDHDDDFLWEGNKANRILEQHGIMDVTALSCQRPRGHVCAMWRDCARRAWKDDCDYYLLVGDDVTFRTNGWMRMARLEFQRLAKHEEVPEGLGCVAFTDATFPGMPTFPIVHRTHLDIFNGEVVPEIFLNQDGDPFLYQLYRRFGCSTLFPAKIANDIGGEGSARYDKQHALGWTFETLDWATTEVEKWLQARSLAVSRKLSLDVIVPCYRVDLPLLDVMLNLQASPSCTTMFIIIVDNPGSPHIRELQAKYGARADVRIRVNRHNLGASASRNRGLIESAAEWVLFLDDDVSPAANILEEAEKVIREHPRAAGFIGYTEFPEATTVYTTAVHLSMVTYFWGIARKLGPNDMPWGVTANLIARRGNDGVEFDLRFPKTGGGEDIDYCRKKRESSLRCGGEGFWAAPKVTATHPWWNGGARSYRRFFMWAKGDGALIGLYPELTFMDAAPNSAELLLMTALIVSISLAPLVLYGDMTILCHGFRFGLAVFMANIVHDLYRHLWRERDQAAEIRSSLGGVFWLCAILESSLIRMWSEIGRVLGILERGEFRFLGRRFDWFAERLKSNRMEERQNAKQRLYIVIGIWAVLTVVL